MSIHQQPRQTSDIWHCALRSIFVLASLPCVVTFGRDAEEGRVFQSSTRDVLGTENNRTASVRLADLDGDRDLDVVVANGRHWPQQNFVFENSGNATFQVQRLLSQDRRASYAAEAADLDGDGDLDLAVGNDRSPNRVWFNDGSGRFAPGPIFGQTSSVRSLTLVDLDQDGDQDILLTCRGRPNQICLNRGDGHFAAPRPFGTKADSTIDVAVTDWNGDGTLDLVLANRDSQRNSILLNDGQTNFKTALPFGLPSEQTRAVAAADLNGDGHPDLIAGNIGQSNRIYLSDGKGKIIRTVSIGRSDGRTYALAVADMDNDKDLDLIVGNAVQQNAVFFNAGDGTRFSESRFGRPEAATYGLDTGDLDGDGFRDIAVANSDSRNVLFLNRPASSVHSSATAFPKQPPGTPSAMREKPQPHSRGRASDADWPAFRGKGARGVADGYAVRAAWNADPGSDQVRGVLWATDVPGLGHSSPVVSGEHVYLATAIAADGKAPLEVGRGGQPDAANDHGEQSWVVLCYDRSTGDEIWRQVAHRGVPRATRHAKATHANTSLAIAEDRIVACFGAEGVYCYDLDGTLLWTTDLGVVNISKYGIGWGYASSPAIQGDVIALVCDDPDNPFLVTLRLSDGKEVWRKSRKNICERSWGTPLIHSSPDKSQIVVNGWPWVVSYDLKSGDEQWRIRGGGDNPVPTPFESDGWIYITSAHGGESPIYVVSPEAKGDVTPPATTGSNESILWSTRRGGAYMSTPVVYGGYLYLGMSSGVVRCLHAKTGERVYEERLASGASIIASLTAADGKIYCPSESGTVYVLKAGPEFKVLARNPMGQPCFATPALSQGVLFIRTTERLVAIQ